MTTFSLIINEYSPISAFCFADNVVSKPNGVWPTGPTRARRVLRCISSFENGIGLAIEEEYKNNGGEQLTLDRVKELIAEQEQSPAMQPFIYDARSKMASRDVASRDMFHNNIAGYLRAVTPEAFDRFIGDKSIDFDEIIELPENKAVLKRLKQADDDE